MTMLLCTFSFVNGTSLSWQRLTSSPHYSHVAYTIPVATILTVILGPLFTRRDIYKICFLQIVAVTYTIPW